jgi:hypothetical protein
MPQEQKERKGRKERKGKGGEKAQGRGLRGPRHRPPHCSPGLWQAALAAAEAEIGLREGC